MSHLLQMRGLKRNQPYKHEQLSFVASFTDAWIETVYIFAMRCMTSVASFTDAWIETVVVNIVN